MNDKIQQLAKSLTVVELLENMLWALTEDNEDANFYWEQFQAFVLKHEQILSEEPETEKKESKLGYRISLF